MRLTDQGVIPPWQRQSRAGAGGGEGAGAGAARTQLESFRSATVVSARLIGQFGLILWGESSDSAHFFLEGAT